MKRIVIEVPDTTTGINIELFNCGHAYSYEHYKISPVLDDTDVVYDGSDWSVNRECD